jgi:very-short-patch-repair endonuclease
MDETTQSSPSALDSAARRRPTTGPPAVRPPGRYTADSAGPRSVPPAVPYVRRRRAELAARARDGELVRVRRGVYLPSPHLAASTREEWLLAEVRGLADRLSTPFWVSHDTAALLWGCWTWRLPPFVHMTQLGHPNVERERDAVVRRHWTDLPARDRAQVGDVPVTSLERTVVDCARSLPLERSLVVVDSALRMGADRRAVDGILEESRGKRGIVRARRALELADPTSESPGETLVRLAAVLGGLPVPRPQVPVPTARGTYVVDLAWLDARVVIEFDGAVKSSGGAYGDPEDVRRAQDVREAALGAAGWTVVRFTWEDLGDPVAVGYRLAEARRLALRRRVTRRQATPR